MRSPIGSFSRPSVERWSTSSTSWRRSSGGLPPTLSAWPNANSGREPNKALGWFLTSPARGVSAPHPSSGRQ
jgi:hypothetical protein